MRHLLLGQAALLRPEDERDARLAEPLQETGQLGKGEGAMTAPASQRRGGHDGLEIRDGQRKRGKAAHRLEHVVGPGSQTVGILVGRRGRLDQPHVADAEVLRRARDRPQVGGEHGAHHDDGKEAGIHGRNYQAGGSFIGDG